MKTFFKFTSVVAALCVLALLGATPTRASSHNTASSYSTEHSANVSGDEFWDDRFGVPNVAGMVNAIVTNGEDVYVGGTFTFADGIVANNIALWDGTQTHALGTGVSGCNGTPCSTSINALAIQNNTLFVGGNFTTAGGVSANNLAMWDGAQWADVGGGVNGIVYAIAVNGSDVYVGGVFQTAGSITTNSIARWDGSQWHALEDGITGLSVNAIAIRNGSVYVGGQFSQVGNVAAMNVARWDGAAWHALGNGVQGNRVLTFTFDDQTLYAGGEFTNGCLAEWDGATWALSDDLCPDMPLPTQFAWIQILAVWNGKLHALVRSSFGGFSMVAWLENDDWTIGPTSTFQDIQTFGAGNLLYVGGNGIRAWDGSAWSFLFNAHGQGLGGAASALAVDGTTIYVGGFFGTAGKLAVNNIARWDGTQWSALGDGLDGGVRALAIHNNELYVGGEFTHAGGVQANHIARWDGSQWSSIGDGVNGAVYAIVFDGDEMLVGGTFTEAGGVRANNIARWNGAAWLALGRGTDGIVRAIAIRKGNIYAGGSFARAGTAAVKNIARWDGQKWMDVGGGVNDFVAAIVADGKKIYVGGGFTQGKIKYVALWNGKRWSALGNGTDGNVQALALRDGTLFVGGNFNQVGQVNGGGIAKWDGSRWSALGAGTNGGAYAIAHSGNDVIAAGTFQTTGDKSAGNFGIWHDPSSARAMQLAPTNNQVVPKQKVKLDWNDASGATGYALQLRKQGDNKNIVNTTTTASEFRTASLERGVKYAWRVQGCANIGGENYWSAWTAWRKFTIRTK